MSYKRKDELFNAKLAALADRRREQRLAALYKPCAACQKPQTVLSRILTYINFRRA